MKTCAICRSLTGDEDGISLFSFPKNEIIRGIWENAVGGPGFVSKPHHRLCSKHFESSAYDTKTILMNLTGSKRRLREDGVPTIAISELSMAGKAVLVDLIAEERDKFDDCYGDQDPLRNSALPWPVDVSTQTDEFSPEATVENVKLKKKIADLEKSAAEICRSLEKNQSLLQNYRKLFPPGYQKRIETGTSSDLSQDDKAFAVALQSMGPKAYKFLRANNFPFPHISTLRDHTSKLKKGFGNPQL